MTEPGTATATAAAVHAVSLKLPTFLASRPDVWFQQTEAQFALRHITDSTTQYFYLLTALDPVVAERMAGDVALAPEEGKYAYLKGKLMEVYGLTDEQKADRLLDLSGLGDWKPSQLCAHMQGLAVDKYVLRLIFLRQLPLPALARKADIIMAAKQASSSVCASSRPPRKKSPSQHPDKPTLCWYHAKFGDKAKTCRPPCAHTSSTSAHGKRIDQHLVAQVSGPNPSHLLYVRDRNSGRKLLELRSVCFRRQPANATGRKRNHWSPPMAARLTLSAQEPYHSTLASVNSCGLSYWLM